MNKVNLTSFLKGEVTKQEVFDYVLDHLRKQGKVSFQDGMCMYRGQDGTKCAIGAIIPDSEYIEDMEAATVDAMCRKFYGELCMSYFTKDIYRPNSPVEFLDKLQYLLHDTLFNGGVDVDSDFAKRLDSAARDFASTCELEYKEC